MGYSTPLKQTFKHFRKPFSACPNGPSCRQDINVLAAPLESEVGDTCASAFHGASPERGQNSLHMQSRAPGGVSSALWFQRRQIRSALRQAPMVRRDGDS